jgi:predicted RNA-binding Zn-ribbon protein involved in translation (DUF1610 family)
MTVNINAKLRTCASCEWLFKESVSCLSCPKCGFAHYGARFVYGDKCYKYSKTQQPWLDKKIVQYIKQLRDEVRRTNVREKLSR